MTRNTRIFADIDATFTAHPITGDVVRMYDEYAIKNSVKHLIQMSAHDKKFHPEVDSGVQGLLFELSSPMTGVLLSRAITDVLNNFEPRIEVLNVEVNLNPDNNAVYVSIIFRVINTEKPITVDVVLYRAR